MLFYTFVTFIFLWHYIQKILKFFRWIFKKHKFKSFLQVHKAQFCRWVFTHIYISRICSKLVLRVKFVLAVTLAAATHLFSMWSFRSPGLQTHPFVKGDHGERNREALIEFDNEDDPFKLLCSTCSKSVEHSANTRTAPLPVTRTLCRIDPG